MYSKLNATQGLFGATVVFKGQELYVGQRIGHLKLLMRVRPKTTGTFNLRKQWRCECVCGNRITVPEFYLVRQNPKQHCGAKLHTDTLYSTHKQEYGIWSMMRARCYDVNHVGYKHYGGRGIKICDEWLNNFEAFLNFVGPRPSPNHTIDRVDPDGWYKPYNDDGSRQVRWATWKEQNNNKRMHKKPKPTETEPETK